MTLTLPPRELEGEVTGDLSLDAGSLTSEGRFDTLSATVSAGSLTVDGGADSVTTRISAGSATLRLEDVTTANLSMSAGDMNAVITGSQPDLVRLDVSAGGHGRHAAVRAVRPVQGHLCGEPGRADPDRPVVVAPGRVDAVRGQHHDPRGELSRLDFVIAPPSGKVLEVDTGL